MYIHVYICKYIYVYIYMYIYICIYICIYTYVFICIHEYMQCIYVYAIIYAYTQVYTWVQLYEYYLIDFYPARGWWKDHQFIIHIHHCVCVCRRGVRTWGSIQKYFSACTTHVYRLCPVQKYAYTAVNSFQLTCQLWRKLSANALGCVQRTYTHSGGQQSGLFWEKV